MRKMPDRHFPLYVDIGEKWPLVVDPKGKDAVLIGQLESGAEEGTVRCGCDGKQRQAVERREHREFELESVCRGDDEWLVGS